MDKRTWNKCIVLCQTDGNDEVYCEQECCEQECTSAKKASNKCRECLLRCYGGTVASASLDTCYTHDCQQQCEGDRIDTYYWYVCDYVCDRCMRQCMFVPNWTAERCKHEYCRIPCTCANRVESIDQICTRRMGSCMAAGESLEHCQNEHYHGLLGCEERLPGLYNQVCERCMFFCMSEGHSYESCETKYCTDKLCKGRLSIPCDRCSNSRENEVSSPC